MPEMEPAVAEASDSESEDEAPPPLPPPRTESLGKELVTVGGTQVLLTDAEPFDPALPHNTLPGKLVHQVNGHLEEEAGGSESGTSSASSGLTSADQSPNKIILTEQKLEERKR